jgi:hypothetical protein
MSSPKAAPISTPRSPSTSRGRIRGQPDRLPVDARHEKPVADRGIDPRPSLLPGRVHDPIPLTAAQAPCHAHGGSAHSG